MARVENDEVEQPFIEQLTAMGWTHVHGPDLGRRGQDRRSAVLTDRLGAALRRINRLPDGTEWLDEAAVRHAVDALQPSTALDPRSLLEANQDATDLLLHGIQVPGDTERHRGQRTQIHYIAWAPEHLDHNEFLVVDQFRIDLPGGDYRVLDLVLFVNGIPVAVVECKNPTGHDPIGAAIDDLRHYRGDPPDPAETAGSAPNGAAPGVPHLFRTVQLLIAAAGQLAVLGTISSADQHFAAWRSLAPVDPGTVRAELHAADLLPEDETGTTVALTEQQKLVGVVLRHGDLLNIIRHYVLVKPVETESGLREVKIVCRYHQYRAVERAVRKLRGRGSGDINPRGGVIWHTQGSGKSLTMTFLLRRMRTDPELTEYLVVVVTDRTQLQDQLDKALRLSEEKTVVAKTRDEVEYRLKAGGRQVVLAMIQKYHGGNSGKVDFAGDAATDEADRSLAEEYREAERRQAEEQTGESGAPKPKVPEFPLCNDSPNVLVLVDEAHRSHTSMLHACLDQAVPNAAYLGFTGTPIMRDHWHDTARIFGAEPDGGFLDEYRMPDAERDGMIVRIRYEGRTGPAKVTDSAGLDQEFDDLVRDRTPEQRAALAKRWPTERDVAESEPLIRAKAKDMLRHWVVTCLPGGFKAQVAAVSRRAAVLYRDALMQARNELLAQVANFDPLSLQGRPPEELSEQELLLATAWRFREVLRRVEFVPVISAGEEYKHRQWREWTEEGRQQQHIARFHDPLPMPPPSMPWAWAATPDGQVAPSPPGPSEPTHLPWDTATDPQPTEEERGPAAFLIVKSMLLTGFDAPIEQALYLDRPIRDAELLQAVARVNRPAPGKDIGHVVDYHGVFQHLDSALAAYRRRDVTDTMRPRADEVGPLRRSALAVEEFLRSRGIEDLEDPGRVSEAMLILADDADRAEFDELLRDFTKALERVLPDRAGLEFVRRHQRLAWLQTRLRRHYRDDKSGAFSLRHYGRKVRAMIADHLHQQEIEQAIPPVSITDLGFDEAVADIADPREAAAEMAHALRFHLDERLRRTDPERYRRLSERLENILQNLQDRWEEQRDQLGSLIDEARDGDEDPETAGLDPPQQALYRIIRESLPDAPVDSERPERLRRITVELSRTISTVVSVPAYQGKDSDVHRLASRLFNAMRDRWHELNVGPGGEVIAHLAQRLAAYGQDNLAEFRRRPE